MPDFTLIVPFYRNVEMLQLQEKMWADYDPRIKIILVDDGSPESAADILSDACRAEIYRVDADIPWNRNGARNLGAHVADTKWILHTDIDHILAAPYANDLIDQDLDDTHWYKFKRFRLGAADETRQKDTIPAADRWGEIKPHIDSYLCTKELYWAVGGYDEDYSGSLGGSAPFLSMMQSTAVVRILDDTQLYVVTRHVCKDASDNTLSRSRSRYEKLRQEKGNIKGENPIRFEWSQVR